MVKITEAGVYDMPAEAYRADPCPAPSLSSSGARLIMQRCPALYWHQRQNPSPSTRPMELGTIAHRLVLEGRRVEDTHLVVPKGFSMEHTTKHADLIAELKQTGKRPVRQEDFDTIAGMAEALRAHEWASAAFTNGRAEPSLFWRDRYFGIWCRARLDFLPAGGSIVADYKTCVSAEPEAIRRAVKDHGYHMQADWNSWACRELGLIDNPTFLLVFQEKEPPWLIVPVVLDDDALDWGAALNGKAREIFCRCLDAGRWPGYADDILTLGLPAYERRRLQDMDEMGRLAIAMQAPLQEDTA